jgi:uncharacterized protein (DUF433 family)
LGLVHEPHVMVAKPLVKGTRIPFERVVAHLANNPDLTDLFAVYPELTIDDVNVCLAYTHRYLQRNARSQKPRP